MLGSSERIANSTSIAGPGIGIAVSGLVALAIAMGIGRFAFTPILPMMQADAAISVAQGGWLASANYLGYLLGAVTAINAQINPTTAVRWGLLIIALATLGMGLTDDFGLWFLLRFVAGAASAWALIFVSAWSLGKLATFHRPILVSTVFAGVGAGIVGTGLICIALMRFDTSSAQAWVLFGVVSFLLSLAIWHTFDAPTEAGPKSRPRAGAGWTGDSTRLVLCYGIAGFGYIIPATFLPVMAKQIIRDPAIFGWSWPVFGLAAAISTLMVAGLQKALGNRRVWVASHLFMAFGVALPVLWPGPYAIALAALLVGGTFMVITMTGMQEAREVGGQQAIGLMAAMTSAFAVGQIVGPASVSFLLSTGGNFSWALLAASFLLTASAGVLLLSPRRVQSA